jgi:hypothetical protein
MAFKRKSCKKTIWLWEELLLVLKGNDKASLADFFDDTKCLLKFAYLADIYRHFSTLNTRFYDPK